MGDLRFEHGNQGTGNAYVDALQDALISHASETGFFTQVNFHEPKKKPGKPLTMAFWLQHMVPIPQESSLNTTGGRIFFQGRIYSDMLKEPQDTIDSEMLRAGASLLVAYSQDFTLDGLVKMVDLLGAYGESLSMQAGYLSMDEGRLFRVLDIDIPLIVNDLFRQAP